MRLSFDRMRWIRLGMLLSHFMYYFILALWSKARHRVQSFDIIWHGNQTFDDIEASFIRNWNQKYLRGTKATTSNIFRCITLQMVSILIIYMMSFIFMYCMLTKILSHCHCHCHSHETSFIEFDIVHGHLISDGSLCHNKDLCGTRNLRYSDVIYWRTCIMDFWQSEIWNNWASWETWRHLYVMGGHLILLHCGVTCRKLAVVLLRPVANNSGITQT